MGRLFIITGPSGTGKDSVLDKMKEKGFKFYFVVTTTSRPPREGESEGSPYYFVSKAGFKKLIKEKGLLEWVENYGNYYGSTKREVERALEKNNVVIIRPDTRGARTIRKEFPGSKVIFIAPPSMEILEKRLRRRGKDKEESIKKRLASAEDRMKDLGQWDCVITNEEDMLDEAAQQAIDYIESH